MFGFLKKLFGFAPTETAAQAPYKVEAKPVEDLADVAVAQRPAPAAAPAPAPAAKATPKPAAKTPAKKQGGSKPAAKAPAKKQGAPKPTGQKPRGGRKLKAAKPAAK